MELEVIGVLHEKYDIVHVNEKFSKREFVVRLEQEISGNIYTDYAKFQLVQNKCEIIERFKVGDTVKVMFNIKGNRHEKFDKVTYITNLDAWRVDKVDKQ